MRARWWTLMLVAACTANDPSSSDPLPGGGSDDPAPGTGGLQLTTAVPVGGAYIPLMGDVPAKRLAFAISATSATAYGAECATTACTPRWTQALSANTIARGLADINSDGFPDLMLLTTTTTTDTCANGAS